MAHPAFVEIVSLACRNFHMAVITWALLELYFVVVPVLHHFKTSWLALQPVTPITLVEAEAYTLLP